MYVRMTVDPKHASVGLLILLAVAGCTIRLTPTDGSQGPVVATTILITIVNETGKALDPQIYVASIADGMGNLFDSGNQRADFGLGARGIIEPGKDATISTACDPPVFIATQGGVYGDDLNYPIGQGQSIVLEQDENVYCGDRVTITYALAGGAMRTSYSVGPQ